jgi:hypothetical protein
MSELFKSKNWQWSEFCKIAPKAEKQRFTMISVLCYYDPKLPIIVETDICNFAVGAIQSEKEDHDQPVAFYCKKLMKKDLNYNIDNEEMLEIVSAFKKWRSDLEGTEHLILVFSDYKNVEYFIITKVLNGS